MRKYILIAFLGCVFCTTNLYSQTNVPTTATGPSSATARSLPAFYPEASIYYHRTLTPVMPTTDSSLVRISTSVDSIITATQYYDYLGRPLQNVIKQASPGKRDFVVPYLFDEFNRISVQYLPYVQASGSGNDGRFKYYSLQADSTFYTGMFSGEQIFYSQKTYDASPLQRVKKITAQGNSWTGADRGISYSQRANTTSDSVRLWTIAITGEDDIPTTSATYQAGSLLVQEITDERGVKAITYVDELGRTILTKSQVASYPSTGHAGWLCTYYVYDEMSHLRMMIAPKAVEALNNSTVNWDLTYSSGAINKGLCYAYYYDDRGRVMMKRIPGKGKSYIAYDLFDRMVMTQDSNLRQTNQWAFIKYDGQSRPYRSGVITTTLSKDSVWAQAARSSDYPTLSGTYTIMTEAGYDDYSSYPSTAGDTLFYNGYFNSGDFITSYNTSPLYAQEMVQSKRIRGAATWAKKIILGTSDYIYTTTIYDDYGRAIQVKERNSSMGAYAQASMQYSFTGLTLRTHLWHQKSGTNSQSHTLLTKYSYDHVGRLTSLIKNIDNTGDKTVSRLTYNELGQLQADTLGNNLTVQKYTYNIRGWLSAINKGFTDTAGSTSAYFGESLFYDWGFNNVQYNGAVAGAKWKGAGDGIARAYGFSYDNPNRLIVAEFSQQNEGSTSWTNDKLDFTTDNLTYDAGGNILTMKQRGWKLGGLATIDSLTYQYFSNSNQLQKVIDGSTANGLLGDFKDSTNTGDDYTYDVNGNITKDYNRQIRTTSNGNGAVYNLLDKPDSIAVAGKSTVYYSYDAAGTMLKKQVNDYSSGSLVRNEYIYISGFVYKNDSAQYALYEKGRLRYDKDSSKFFYDYFLKDHLGNVRTVLTEEQRTDAYPTCTMETANATIEEAYYGNVSDTRIDLPSGYPDTTSNHKVAIVKGNYNFGSTHLEIGPNILLKVMAGDKFNLQVNSWWNSGLNPDTSTNPLGLSQILSAIGASPILQGGGHFSASDIQNSTELYNAVSGFLSGQPTPPGTGKNKKPKAFVNWILFDEQFNLVSSNSGFELVAGNNTFTTHTRTNLPVSKNGYLFVYVSNETPDIDVYFDNLQVTHIRGPLLQEQAYYPFGLEMTAISSNSLNFASPNNNYKFNGGIEWEESLNLYSTFLRGYDQQIGRFNGVDVLSEKTAALSGYQFSFSNPISFNDPLGDYAASAWSNRQNDKQINYSNAVAKDIVGSWLRGGANSGLSFSQLVNNAEEDNMGILDAFVDIDGGGGGGQSSIGFDENGNVIASGDMARQLFMALNDPNSDNYLARYDVYGPDGNVIGFLDVFFGVNSVIGGNGGVGIMFGYKEFGGIYNLNDLNWIQVLTENQIDAKTGAPANIPFYDQLEDENKQKYYNYLVPPDHQKTYRGDNPYWKQFGVQLGKYDYMFGDGPLRQIRDGRFNGLDFYASTSLVVMGPEGVPSATLITVNWGFQVRNNKVIPQFPYEVPIIHKLYK